MSLSRDQIWTEIVDGELEIRREGELHVGPSSIDLHLYPSLLEAREPPNNKVKVDDPQTYPTWMPVKHGLSVKPGEFLLATTSERVSLPASLVGHLDGRSSVGRLGLQVENAGLIDAGFEGQITLELKNQQDYEIELVPEMRICQMTLHEHNEVPDVDYSNQGKYQGQEGPTPSKLYEDFQ